MSPVPVLCVGRLALFIVAVAAQRWARLSNADVVRLLNATTTRLPTSAWATLTSRQHEPPTPPP
ncbi:hypothetical protein I6A60_40130 [Frankia sp. AgB1.9]|uniref:hypothetical protein n=1 Tax=unclassified Frankia TaxID=2632575 RepID=UPI0019331028|nr:MULTISPECIES: hypothetical protein [unclassified Frankia]MBL7553995.1 hypothetical protein [Frankia sp. AgB1.9]MBL7618156.1 hypothetical protein [Frankia sp. AgB1.8]